MILWRVFKLNLLSILQKLSMWCRCISVSKSRGVLIQNGDLCSRTNYATDYVKFWISSLPYAFLYCWFEARCRATLNATNRAFQIAYGTGQAYHRLLLSASKTNIEISLYLRFWDSLLGFRLFMLCSIKVRLVELRNLNLVCLLPLIAVDITARGIAATEAFIYVIKIFGVKLQLQCWQIAIYVLCIPNSCIRNCNIRLRSYLQRNTF